MKSFALTIRLLLILVISLTEAVAQTSLCTWNLRDFGKSKDDKEIAFIAQTIKSYDIIAIQEVVAGDGGAKTVARLADQLNKLGEKWDYVVSDPTSGESSYKRERYAFLWKPSKALRLGEPWLEKKYTMQIDREPFLMTFKVKEKLFTICNFHAITKSLNPETEIKYFKFLPAEYSKLNLIFCGDFNLPASHSVFNPLKTMGYLPALDDKKTSLRQKCIKEDCVASAVDNVFYNSKTVEVLTSEVRHFYKEFSSITEATKISDHMPVVVKFRVSDEALE